jgi:hypothetical protein
MTDLPIKIRGLSHPEIPLFDDQGVVTNQEKAFIASSWSHKERANPVYFWVSKKAFHHQFYLNVICMLIDARPELFLIAYNSDFPDQILGWVCSEQNYLRPGLDGIDWVIYQHYVKEDFREYGVKDILIGLRDVPRPSRDCKPQDFERLINDTRKKNQVTKASVSQAPTDTRQECAIPTR